MNSLEYCRVLFTAKGAKIAKDAKEKQSLLGALCVLGVLGGESSVKDHQP